MCERLSFPPQHHIQLRHCHTNSRRSRNLLRPLDILRHPAAGSLLITLRSATTALCCAVASPCDRPPRARPPGPPSLPFPGLSKPCWCRNLPNGRIPVGDAAALLLLIARRRPAPAPLCSPKQHLQIVIPSPRTPQNAPKSPVSPTPPVPPNPPPARDRPARLCCQRPA